MNRKIVIVVLIVIIFITACAKKDESTQEDIYKQKKISTVENKQITNIGVPSKASPSALDSALAEITFISEQDERWKIRIDKIRDYIRYPRATYPQLKEGDEVNIFVLDFIDTYQNTGPTCPEGYVKAPKPGQASSNESPPSTRPIPKIIAGDKYVAQLHACFTSTGLGCEREGWSAYLYNSNPLILESECVLPSSTQPAIKPQKTLPSVEPKQ